MKITNLMKYDRLSYKHITTEEKLLIYPETPNPYSKNITSKEIWEYDKIKNDELIKLGYTIVIVWEADYKINKEQIIIDTIKTIKERDDEYRNRE